jgi:8-oxo-dGTP pyrophosphatase MutT (NUDIX family)
LRYRPSYFYRQSGVIPYRVVDGEVEILLITSRRKGRWIIPKGVIELWSSASDSACKEAYEEAGIKGRPSRSPIGEYRYNKWGGVCVVQVFLLEVETMLETWPEKSTRQRQWMTIAEAARSVAEPELQRLILKVSEVDIQSRIES